MDLIFNELSLQPPLAGLVEARGAMTGIVDTLSAAVRRRTIQSLRTDSQFVGRGLTDGYTVGHWLNDGAVDRVAQRLDVPRLSAPPLEHDGAMVRLGDVAPDHQHAVVGKERHARVAHGLDARSCVLD